MKNELIKGVIFDLDNTLLDFMKMKEFAVKAAIKGMIEAGLKVNEDKSYIEIKKENNNCPTYYLKNDNYRKLEDKIIKYSINHNFSVISSIS